MKRKELKYIKTKPKNVISLKKFYRCISQRRLKSSKRRTAIIEFFINADRHFAVEQLYNEIKKTNPKIGYSTVYRTLKLLVDCGMANICSFGDGSTRFEPTHMAKHHDHLICQKCSRIIEFENREIEALQKGVAQKFNFLVQSHKLELYGVCNNCRKKRIKRKRK